ncbi:MAG: Holliday junction resolvase RuvX [Patescibacteria group bacterium]|nr:Holliday junction resolvase RuvX [Patescibacteria group bacterium]
MKILGIDYGRAKVGLAVADIETKLATPLTVVSLSNLNKQLPSIVKEHHIGKIVIGIPGGKIEKEIREFGRNLQKEISLSVEFFDETLTTQEAQKVLISSGKKRKARREMEDAFAAAIMLELFLEGGSHYD